MKMRRFLKSKLHTAIVTDANLNYEGSITIDEDLMELAGFEEYEFVLVGNMNNGHRFETYVIKGERGSGDVCLNGATARLGLPGDTVIIFTTVLIPENEIHNHKPTIVALSNNNKSWRVIE